MNEFDTINIIETKKSGFDYPSENVIEEGEYEEVSKWLDDYGWM